MNKKIFLLALSASFVLTSCGKRGGIEAGSKTAQDSYSTTSSNKDSGESSIGHWNDSTVGVLSEQPHSYQNFDDYLGNGVEVLKNAVSIEDVNIPGGNSYKRDANFIFFVDKLHMFGSEVIAKLIKGSEENVCVSLFSIVSVLTMLTECSGDEVRQLISDKFDITIGEMRENMIKLIKMISPSSNSHGHYILDICNSIWIRDNAEYSQECVNNLSSYFAASTFGFSDTNTVEKALDAYVFTKTNGLINPNLELTDDVVFVIMNVIYLKDSWFVDTEYELSKTEQEYDFHNSDGTITRKKLLQGFYCDGQIASFEKHSQFYIDTENGVRLTFLVPNDGYELDEVMTDTQIFTARDTYYKTTDYKLMEDYHTKCIFPEFEASYKDKILDAVKESIGIENNWYLNSLSEDENTIQVLEIDHIAKLKVDAKGIVGAAVTMSYDGYGMSNHRQVYETFEITKSFGFIITVPGDVNLFTGVVHKI